MRSRLVLLSAAILIMSTSARPMDKDLIENKGESDIKIREIIVEQLKHEEHRQIVFFFLSTSLLFFTWAIGIFIAITFASKLNSLKFGNFPLGMRRPVLLSTAKDQVSVPTAV